MDNYKNQVENFFKNNNCKLITEYKNSRQKIQFIGQCGHLIECKYNKIQQGYKNLLCKKCNLVNLKNRSTKEKKIIYANNEREYQGLKLLTNILENKCILKRTNEGCKVDLLFKPLDINEDLWLQIQIKTTEKRQKNHACSFIKCNGYDKMLIICICLEEKNFWLFNGTNRKNKISIGKTQRSKFFQYLTNQDKILEKLQNYYYYDSYEKINLNKGLIPVTIKSQKEHYFRNMRKKFCPYLEIKYPNIEASVYDCIILGKKVQDKTAYKSNRNGFKVGLVKRKNGKKSLPYEEGDNDFYWFNLQNEYENYFYIIPEKKLIENGYITTKNQIGKQGITLFPNNSNIKKIKSKWCEKYLYEYNKIDNNILINIFKNV